MTVELFDSYGYDSKGGSFICNAVRKGLKYEPETRVSIKRNALYTFLIESGQETNDINQSPLLYKNNAKNESGGHDYSKDYLTFEALEDGTFQFTQNALQYSIDGGNTWTTLSANTASPTIATGSKIMWKQTGLTPVSSPYSGGIGTFSSTGNFTVSGNIMSLHYGDNFVGQTDLTGKDYAFYGLFSNSKLINASNLILPATTLSTACYELMFMSCSLLKNVPKSLPATTLANTCYHGMFYSCTSLEQGPTVLPGETMKPWCYESMFEECHSLKIAPKIYAKISANRCFNYMFMNCTSLEEGPDIFLSTLSQLSCKNMFTGCSSLKYIKCLATDISAENCTRSWVKGVAANGTFVKNASMSSWTTGDDGIPSGWTVEDYGNVE